MIGYQYNDGGRKAAGRRGHTGDCVVRALAILTGRPYLDCYRDLAEANSKVKRRGRKNGVRSASNGVSKRAYEKVFAAYGLEKIKLPTGARPTWTEAYETYGDCIVSTARHLSAVVDGMQQDTHDERECSWTLSPNHPDLLRDPKPGVTRERNPDRSVLERWERKAMSVWVPGTPGRTL